MGINYNFSKGNDFPVWQWLPFVPVTPYHGFDTDYDGVRYIYMAAQYGISSTSASTTALYRFDTWGHGWQYLATLTSGNRGLTVSYDPVRNVVYIVHGAALTSWQVFNLNYTAISICGVSCAAWTTTTLTPVLPAAADYGAAITTINVNNIPNNIETGTTKTGSTTTTIIDTDTTSLFTDQMVGQEIKFTSGSLNGQKRFISSVTNMNTLVVSSAFSGSPSVGDVYIICLPEGTSTGSNSTTTLNDTSASWITNNYANSDVVIVSGTGAGQKRRITSNTATTLTLAAAVTGNSNTGAWSVTPDATSVYKIQPSTDFLYYQPGSTGTGFYRIDLNTGASAPTWSTLASLPASISGGANIMYPDAVGAFNLFALRGNATSTFYQYNIGANTWSTLTARCGSETFSTGASSTIWSGHRKLIIAKESTTRLYAFDLAKRELEPLATMPYAAGGAYCGKRLRLVTTPDGTQWLYVFRAGGAEFFRVPLEWGD